VSAPPEAHSEYSRGSGAFRRLFAAYSRGARGGSAAPDGPARAAAEAPARAASREPARAASGEPAAGTAAVALVAAIGALLVIVAQFIALYHVRVATSSVAVKTVGTGSNHGWAALPLALVCLALALAVYRHGNRTALLGLSVLGIATLVIALAVDLPDVHATGLIGSSAGQFQRAANSPAAGLYLETLGSVLLLVSGGLGLLMLGPSVRIALPAIGRRPRSAPGSRASAAGRRHTRASDAPPAAAPAEVVAEPAGRDAAEPGRRGAGERAARDATEPEDSRPETAGAGPADPAATPPAPKSPLSLGAATRRRWSAS
jgi:hypothetical protein